MGSQDGARLARLSTFFCQRPLVSSASELILEPAPHWGEWGSGFAFAFARRGRNQVSLLAVREQNPFLRASQMPPMLRCGCRIRRNVRYWAAPHCFVVKRNVITLPSGAAAARGLVALMTASPGGRATCRVLGIRGRSRGQESGLSPRELGRLARQRKRHEILDPNRRIPEKKAPTSRSWVPLRRKTVHATVRGMQGDADLFRLRSHASAMSVRMSSHHFAWSFQLRRPKGGFCVEYAAYFYRGQF